jgi:penicillin-binding protein 2
VEPISSLDDPLDDLEEEEEQPEDERPRHPRLTWVAALMLLVVGGLWLRLYQLQIVDGSQFREQADNNRFREVLVPAPRGVIYDRNHLVLARNQPAYSVGIVPADLPTGPERELVIQRLAGLLGVSAASISRADQGAASPFNVVPVANNVAESVAFTVEERHLELPGVDVNLIPSRNYVLGAITAPILGYVGRISDAQYQRLKDDPVHHYSPNDVIGQTGIERTFESQLRGTPGVEQMEVDATGREVQVLHVTNPVPGQNLVLTVDAALQKEIAGILQEGAARYQSGSVVALDPRNGQVLALVNQPSYDDNLFANGISDAAYQQLLQDPRHPLINAAVASAYTPGDTFLPVTALAGLQSGVITPKTTIDCQGFITVPNRFDPTIGTKLFDWRSLGPEDVESALGNACGVFFYEVGGGEPSGKWAGVGVDGLARYAQMFGLGQPTGIDLVEEGTGLVPSVRWKRQTFNQEWVSMDTYQMSVGQGYLTATPLQMASLAATIANGGTLYRPQLVLATQDENGNQLRGFTPDVTSRLPVNPAYLALLRQGMADAVNTGKTSDGIPLVGVDQAAAVKGWPVAAIASTVQYGTPDKSGNLPTHAWAIGFAPVDHPQIALAVFLDHGTGPADAAKVVQQIFSFYHQEGTH